jgi:purine-binding chemotaxis protein CheW
MEAAKNIQNQFLSFTLADDIFAIDVVMAREIVDYAEVTQVPQMPEYMQGVVNLRGAVVPVIDMRLKFGMDAGESTRDTCIIVMEIDSDGEMMTVGALVDSVQEVMDLDPSQIEPAPKIGTKLNTEFIQGMGNLGEKFIIILDINRIFSADEIDVVKAVTDE